MNALKVIAAPNLDPGAGRINMTLPAGLTVAEIVAQALPGASAADLAQVRVTLATPAGSSVVSPQYWHAVRPRAGVSIVIRVVPAKGALRAILTIVVAVAAVALGTMFSPAVGGLLGISGLAGGTLVAAGVNLIGSLLINALVPPVKPDAEKQRNSYAISGWRNRMDPDGAVPVVLGSIRYAPPFAARPWSEIVGDLQYIRSLFLFGEGELNLTDFRIGETSISEYDEIEIEVRSGISTDAPCSLYPRQIVEEAVGVELTRPLPRDDQGEVVSGASIETPITRTTGADAKGASILIAFPAGLIRFSDKGKKRAITVQIRVEQRLAGATNWQAVTTLSISGKRTESFYRQHSWNFPQRGRWEIRLTMLTDESDSSQRQQRTVWAALQTIRPEYPIASTRPFSLVAVRVKATHQLSGALDNFSALASRVCLDWDHVSGSWVSRVTSNPASLYRHVLQSPANPKAVSDAGIDLAQLQDWHDFCRVKGLAYNRVLDQAGTSLRDVLTEIAAAGRATPRHDGMQWGVVIDRPGDLVVDHVSPRNSWNFSCRRAYAERPHGFVVRFQDETNDFKETQRVVPFPGHTGPIELTETLELPGITDPAVIYREATRRMYEAMHRPDVYEVTQDGAARVATRGDTIALSHDVLSSVQRAARVRDVQGATIVLDDAVTMQAGRSYGLRFRRIDAADTVGTSDVRTVLTEPGETDILTLTGSGPAPEPGDLILFGEAGSESFSVVVTSTEATEDMCTILRAVDAAPQIDTLTDATVIPAWSGRVGAEINENFVQPSAPRFAQVFSEVTAAGAAVAISCLIRPGSGSVSSSQFEIQHRIVGAGSWTTVTIPAANGGDSITGYTSGQSVEIRARAVSPAGVAGPYSPTVTHLVGSGGVGIPAALDPASISIVALLGGAIVSFATGDDAYLAQVQIYRSQSPVLDRETDAVGLPQAVSASRTESIALGDTTRQNLVSPTAWTAGAGWTIPGASASHAAGAAGALIQPISTQSGRWYRLGLEISGRSAGTLTPRLTGGSTVSGSAIAANGNHATRLQAVSGNDTIRLAADADFDGSVQLQSLAVYLETAACLAQGTHYIWLESQSDDGLSGPVVGPYTLEVI